MVCIFNLTVRVGFVNEVVIFDAIFGELAIWMKKAMLDVAWYNLANSTTRNAANTGIVSLNPMLYAKVDIPGIIERIVGV